MLKKLLILGLISGILAGIVAVIYQKVYVKFEGAGFETILTIPKIFASCIGGCIIAAIGYWLLSKVLKDNTEPVFNLLFAVLTFASVLGPIAYQLPLDLEAPELFPGLAIPMHLLPAMAWMTLKPLFAKSV